MPLVFKWIIFLCIFLILLEINLHHACYQTTLLPGVYLRDDSSILKANNWSVPIVYDWDNNGKKDLLVGDNYIDEKNVNYGYVSFYKNIGSDAAPVFNGATYIQTCADKCSALNVAAFG